MRRIFRRLVPFVFSAALAAVTAEAIVRVYFATKVGRSVLYYGTPWQRNELALVLADHRNVVGDYRPYAPGRTGAYSKYFPDEHKIGWTVEHETYAVRINNHGFRGRDFDVEKPPGTIRVLTLGASSTFGYYDRDDETYPYYLEELLNAHAPDAGHFEVINLAIPHMTTDNILALFRAEGVRLAPDFVTLYEGINESGILEQDEPGIASRAWQALRRRSLAAAFLNHVLGLGVDSSEYAWSDELAARRSRTFLENVALLRDECRRHGARLIVTTQQAKSGVVNLRGPFSITTQQLKSGVFDPRHLPTLTYDEEVRVVREKLARGEIGPARFRPLFLGPTLDLARVFLIHAQLMHDLRAWAMTADVGFVDLITVLDHDRDLLVSYVHLRPEGNRKIAAALAAEILRELLAP